MPSRRRSNIGRVTRQAYAARKRRMMRTEEERLEVNKRERYMNSKRRAAETAEQREERLKILRIRARKQRQMLLYKTRSEYMREVMDALNARSPKTIETRKIKLDIDEDDMKEDDMNENDTSCDSNSLLKEVRRHSNKTIKKKGKKVTKEVSNSIFSCVFIKEETQVVDNTNPEPTNE